MKRLISFTILFVAILSSAIAQPSIEEFRNPPREFRPRVWWHWMNGNITKDGIRKDLEWMDRAGIVGFHNFDAGLESPRIVDRRLVYMTPEWKDAFNYALDLADSLGMEVSIASSPGWSITGGPWVSEDDAEKKLTWREMPVDGGMHFKGPLPEPLRNCGPYQEELAFKDEPEKYAFYRDICVIAVKCPPMDTARIACSRVRSGFDTDYTITDSIRTRATEDITSLEGVLDITSMYNEGILEWDVPQGRWKVFRFGYNLLGRRNGPASPEATGLEVDKLDREAVTRYYANYLSMYREASNDRLGSVISHLMIDSYESGKGTWTPAMEKEFLTRRHYSLRQWLPVLAGQIIGSAEESERFLFDWRQTLGELIAENHYDVVDGILSPLGMKRHTESHEERTAFVGDGMMVKRHADIPMSAFWVRYRAGWHDLYPTCEADLKESSSVAHIYGQNICAAESFTTNGFPGKWDGFEAYRCNPGNLKPAADAAMACGLNRFIIHTSVHQPSDDHVPGLGLGRYGQWFTRHDTWAEEARTWTDYLSRSCYMLQQGRNVADIAYFYGEDRNVTGRFFSERVSVPEGFNFDFINADILLNMLKVRRNHLVTDTGMDYGILVIDREVRYMSMPVLKKILRLARRGVVIQGPRPAGCANLKASDARFARMVSRVWDKGRRNVIEYEDIQTAMLSSGLERDMEVVSGGSSDSLRFVHRKLDKGDIYWVANLSRSGRKIEVSLRADGCRPVIWHADDGSVQDASFLRKDGRTEVLLDMTPDDSQFIVMTEDTDAGSFEALALTVSDSIAIGGPWSVRFQEGRGAPAEHIFQELESWSHCSDDGIRYFSGSATYSNSFKIDETPFGKVFLDLGEVCDMARVKLNGKDLGLLWKKPFRVDVTTALEKGRNTLEITVTNCWTNRLIGDERPGAKRICYTSMQFFDADSPLLPAGLIGPVTLEKTDYPWPEDNE